MPTGPGRIGWSLPLRAHLLALVVGILLPALIIGAALVRRVLSDNQDAVRSRLLETARAEATLVDSELSGTIRALQALAESDRLTTRDLTAFQNEADRLLHRQFAWYKVVLDAPDGRPIVDTAHPDGTGMVPVVDPSHLQQILATRQPLVGTLRRPVDPSEPLAFPVHVPVVRDGDIIYVLSALITPDRLADILRRQEALTDEWVRGVVDSSGVVVARTRDSDRFVGQKGTQGFLDRFATADEEVYRDTSLEGLPVYGAFARGEMSGWIAGVAVPVSVVDASFRRSMFALAGSGLLLLGLGLFGVYVISSRIARDIGLAAASADLIAGGLRPRLRPSSVKEVQQLSEALSRSAALLDVRQRERDEQVAHADLARGEAEAARVEAEAARAEAEAADRAKDDFLAMLGHELRNPLAPVLTALELMRARGDQSAEREREIINRQVRHLVRLVDDLLDVSRVRRGRVELRRKPFEIIHAIEKAAEIAGPLIGSRGHQLTLDVSNSDLVVDGDETRLAQVFANLLTNAAKYADGPGRITLRASVEGATVVVRCEDDGVGITPELLPRVFELFAQGRQTLDRRDAGLGLGLTVAKTIVELHGGTIEATSDGVGHGSRFTVRLPRSLATVARPEKDLARLSVAGQGSRVLVVDDNRDNAEMMAAMLRFGGFIVEQEYDGFAAIRTMERFQAEVAVLDIGLPSMDGFELARRLRAIDPSRPLRLIAVTGYGQDSDVIASREAGFDLHLVKPVAADALFDALRVDRVV